MSQEQFISLARSIAKILAAILIERGYLSESASAEITGLLVMAAALIWSHHAHAESKTINQPNSAENDGQKIKPDWLL